ncbi:dTMP kinase [Parapedomonas caeni]
MTGRFITLEGGEGTGKSTQVARLAERLRSTGREVIVTREPGGTPGAEAIRALLVQGEVDRWDALSETLLLNAARHDHVERVIRPALARGAWVVCDRYVDSTLVYQGIAKGLDVELLVRLHEQATGPLWPDLTLVLDVPAAIGLARAASRRGDETRFEAHDAAFHERLRAGFLDLAARYAGRCAVIDAIVDVDAVSAAIWQAVAGRLAP